MDDEDITITSRQIEPLLQCSVCLDRFKTPKLLPCQHTYCQEPCLEQLVNPRTRMIKCPECRADHLVPRGGTASFPNNITIMGFMDLRARLVSGGELGRRDEGGINTPRISEKEVPLCKKSQPDVCSSSSGGSHSYGEDSGFSSNIQVVPVAPPRTTCSGCFRTTRLSQCHHCQQQLCDMCCRQHIDQVKVEIERMLYRIKRGLPKLSSSIDDISIRGNQSQQRCQSVKGEITELFERILRDFQARQRFLMEEVDAFLISELENLRIQQENLEVELASMASFCDSSESAISPGSILTAAEIMQLHEQCQENADTLQNFESSLIRRTPLRQLEIKAENQPLIDAIGSFGEVEIVGRPIGARITNRIPDERSYQSRLASRLVDTSRPESSRYEGYTSTRPSTRNMDTDYALSVIGSHNPTASSPASERRRNLPSYLSREPQNLADDSDSYEDRNGRNIRYTADDRNTRPPRGAREDISTRIHGGPREDASARITGTASGRTGRRRLRRDHHSDTRIAGLIGGDDSLFSRYRRRSLGGGLSPPRETEDYDGDEPLNTSRIPTYSYDPPTNPRQPARLEVPRDISPENERNGNSYQRQSRNPASINQNSNRRGGRSPNRVEPRNRYNQKGRAIIRFGSRGNGLHEFTWPRGVAISPLANTIFVADSSNHRVQVFDSVGQYIRTFGSYGTEEGEFDCLAGITVNNLGQVIISDRYNHRIQIFDHNCSFLTTFGEEGSLQGQLSYPWGIACDNMGFIYVCDKENSRIQVFQSNGAFVRSFGQTGSGLGDLDNPQYIAVSPENKIFVSDSSNHRIQVFSMYGDFLFTFGDSGTANGEVKYPRGIAIDSQGFVLVADSGNNRVQTFRPDGTYYSMFGSWGNENGQFKALEGLAILANGNVVVSDRENHRIQIF